MKRIKVMQVTDSLHPAGRQRLAVNLANFLLAHGYESYLCTTRLDGILDQELTESVRRLSLCRQNRFDFAAFRRLIFFNKSNHIQVLHAHGPSVFISGLASLFPPYPKVIWHDHHGHTHPEGRRAWPYQMISRRISGVIAVSQPLVEWARKNLTVSADRIWYIPNFVCVDDARQKSLTLPGSPGSRIVCVAHFRPQKDHLSLLQAMALVKLKCPAIHLLLVGGTEDASYLERLQREIKRLMIQRNVSLLGQRTDISDILRGCDIGVLSSSSEGLPLALLEYGRAGLPAVATNVGQCSEVLDEGRAGILVPPNSPNQLAEALLDFLCFPGKRSEFGERLHRRVQEFYSPTSMINQVSSIYEAVLTSQA